MKSEMAVSFKFQHNGENVGTNLKLTPIQWSSSSALNRDHSALLDFRVSFDLNNELLL